jgi:hypothetical protein
VPTTIRQGDIDLIRALHDVAVRKGKAVRRKEEAGSAACDTLRGPLASGRPHRTMMDLDVYDRWTDLSGCGDYRLRIGIQQVVIGRHRMTRDVSGPHSFIIRDHSKWLCRGHVLFLEILRM